MLYTVGHSAHELDAFLGLLHAHGIEVVADVRIVPRSRHVPHFDAARLGPSLREHGIAYHHLRALGGWRRALPDSPNGGWRNSSFRGYADHMLTPEWEQAFAVLVGLAAGARTAAMCAEGSWWRCHRRLIADRMLAGGGTAWHIGTDGRLAPHALPDFAQAQGERVLYPPQERAAGAEAVHAATTPELC